MTDHRIRNLLAIASRDSTNDHEALIALRKACSLLAADGRDLPGLVGDGAPPTTPPTHARIEDGVLHVMGPAIQCPLDTLGINPDDSMVNGIHSWLSSNGPHTVEARPINNGQQRMIMGISGGQEHPIWAGPTGPAMMLTSALRSVIRTPTK